MKSKNKKLIADILLGLYIGLFLRLAIPLEIISLFPVLLPVFFPSAFKPLTAIQLVFYLAAVLITVSTSLLIIKKRGKKYFFRELFLYNVYYSGTSGRYYQIFVISLVSLAIFSVIASFIGGPSYIKFWIVLGLAVLCGFFGSKMWPR